MTTTTTAATRFAESIDQAWDHLDCWTASADGLSDVDAEALSAICDETGDDYAESLDGVMAYIRAHLGDVVRRAANGGR